MADEIAWVIVHRNVTPGGPNYWCGNGWSIDNQRAIRFAREIDAQRTLAGFDEDDPLPNEQPHRVEEHMWLDGPRSPSVSGSPAPSIEASENGRIRTDDALAAVVMQAILECANAWEGDARIIGNVRAQDMRRAICEWDAELSKLRETWRPRPLPPAPDASRTALAGITAPSEVDAK